MTWWPYLSSFGFAQPWWLLLLLLMPGVAWLIGKAGRGRRGVPYSSTALLAGVARQTRNSPGRWRFVLPLIVLVLCSLAMARPRTSHGVQEQTSNGIDIMLVLDISGSMDTQDFRLDGKPISRWDALTRVVGQFVDRRPHDRIGCVGFMGDPYLIAPLTLDHQWIKTMLTQVKLGWGTAIGSGMIAGAEALKHSQAKTRIEILVSDGENTTGIAPLDAARTLNRRGIRVYPIQVTQHLTRRIAERDKNPFHRIASITGGQFFQATSLESLQSIYAQIDRLEKSKIHEKHYTLHDELFPWFVIPALGLALMDYTMRRTRWLTIP